MLPKLYKEVQLIGGEITYRYLGTLSTCRKCDVKEVRNGAYTLALETTVNDDCSDLILSQRMIGVKPNPFDDMQFFEIQKTVRTINGIIKVEAKHIKCLCFAICTNAYGAQEDDPISYSGTPKQTWDEICNNYIDGTVPFSFDSDISTPKTFFSGLSVSESLGNILGGKEGSFIDTWGGEFWWDNFNIYLKRSRGKSQNYKLRYGQNISDASQSESSENTYSHIMPYAWYNTESGVKVSTSESPIEIPNNQAEYNKTFVLDCSEVLEPYVVGPIGSTAPNAITSAEAKALIIQYAQEYARVHNLGSISVNIEVDLRAELDDMSQIGLCDTINVILDNFGTEATAKITEVTYDALLERWKKIVVGVAAVTLAGLILNKRRYNL